MNDGVPEPTLEPFNPSAELSLRGRELVQGFALQLAQRWAEPQTVDGLATGDITTPEFMGGLTTLTMADPKLAADFSPPNLEAVQSLVQGLVEYFEGEMPVPDYAALRDAFLYVGLHHSLFAPDQRHDFLFPLRRAFWNHYMKHFNEIHDLIETGSPSAMAFFTICGILIPQDNRTSGLTVARFEKGKKQLKERLDELDPITKERNTVRNILDLDGTEMLQRTSYPVVAIQELASLAESLLICASQLKKESHAVSLRKCKTFCDLISALKHVVDHPKDPIPSEDYAYAVRALRLLTVAGIYISETGEVILQDSTSISD